MQSRAWRLSIKQRLGDAAPGVYTETSPDHADDERRHRSDGGTEPPADGAPYAGSEQCEELGHKLAPNLRLYFVGPFPASTSLRSNAPLLSTKNTQSEAVSQVVVWR